MFKRRKSKYNKFSPEDMPSMPPKPDEADLREIEKLGPEDSVEKTPKRISDESEISPPLFIKIDKYKDIANQVRRLKSLSLGLRDALDALTEIEKEIANGVVVANNALDELNIIIRDLDLRFAKVRGAEERRIPKATEDYVRQGYERVEKLKRKFDRLEE